MLTKDSDLIAALRTMRHELHRHPELSGQESQTAQRITRWLDDYPPDQLLTGLGGHGVAAIYCGADLGPTVLIRAELDGLPIHETGQPPHRSQIEGKAHLCGHDGHMTILAGLAAHLFAERPAQGRVVLLFQPAEEDGSGAAAVLADPRYANIAPDYAFAIHNMPGIPLGHARIAAGPMNCASRGVRIALTGRTAHASMPETGLSPAPAMAALIPALGALSRPVAFADREFRMITVTHARLGAPAFGVAPGDAELWVTLRCHGDDGMEQLLAETTALIQQHTTGLKAVMEEHDVFAACTNDPEATAIFQRALDGEAVVHDTSELPMRASEDFGRFGNKGARSSMALIGAGAMPALHNSDYDFPDALIPLGLRLFRRIVRDVLG